MKILIATRNKDKYKIIKKLLETTIYSKEKFYSLDEINEDIEDKKESGTISNRAYEKAYNVYSNIKNKEFDFIVGIDDGIEMKSKLIENVKDYIKDIIDDKYLVENEKVFIVRAYSFINKNGNVKDIITRIPFVYKKTNHPIEIISNSYPLSHVLTEVDKDITISEQNFEDSNDYYKKYSLQEILKVKDYFDDIK